MPEYLSVSFQYSKKKITDQTIRAFCDVLFSGGVSFAGDCKGNEGASCDEIIDWNQRKLEQNFELGYTEHSSHDYKQMRLQYADFSELRLFINNEREQDFFSFELLFLQDELFVNTAANTRALRKAQLSKIEKLAVHMWENENMDCIQAGWELADAPVSHEDIAGGDSPLIDPFCILPKSLFREEWQAEHQTVGRNGVFLRDVERFHSAEHF